MALGDHLGAHQNVVRSLAEALQDGFILALGGGRVAIQARDARFGKLAVQLFFNLLRADTQKVDVLALALGAVRGDAFGIVAVMAKQAAVGNAEEARRVVFDLFQDLDDFRLDDYKPFSDVESSLARLIRFLSAAMEESGHRVRAIEKSVYEIEFADGRKLNVTTDRDLAKDRQDL